MNIFRTLGLTLAFATGSAQALVPETGLWGGLGENGRGLSIEIQDDNMFVTYYGYQPDGGKSAFYTSLGKYNPTTGVMTGYFAAAENGQCYGCPPRAPTLTDLGQVRFEFTSRTTATMRLPGVTNPINIVRSVLRGNTWADRQELYGVWQIVDGAGIWFGEAVWFKEPSTTVANGFNGTRWGTTRLLVGGPMSSTSGWSTSILIDASTSYYSFYAFNPTGNGWAGRSWTFLKSENLSGSGLPSTGFKTLGKEFAIAGATLSNPGAAASVSDAVSEATAEARHLATREAAAAGSVESVQIGDTTVPLAELAASAASLKAQIEAAR